MFTFIILLFKILISFILTFCVIHFSNSTKDGGIQNKNLLVFALFFTSFLSFLKVLSSLNESLNVGFGILSASILFALYVYFNIGNIKKYFIIFLLSLFISIGYIITALMVFLLYVGIDKYSNFILEYFKNDFENKENDIASEDLE